jgi:hypothetical protein
MEIRERTTSRCCYLWSCVFDEFSVSIFFHKILHYNLILNLLKIIYFCSTFEELLGSAVIKFIDQKEYSSQIFTYF